MTQKHTSRHGNIFTNPSVRRRIWTGARDRDPANFGAHLSGGAYGGVTLLEEGVTFHQDNGDEATYGTGVGNFSKGLQHGLDGLPVNYPAFDAALETARSDAAMQDTSLGSAPVTNALEAALVANSSTLRSRAYVNPLGGLATDPIGLDPYGITMPPAPALASEIAAA